MFANVLDLSYKNLSQVFTWTFMGLSFSTCFPSSPRNPLPACSPCGFLGRWHFCLASLTWTLLISPCCSTCPQAQPRKPFGPGFRTGEFQSLSIGGSFVLYTLGFLLCRKKIRQRCRPLSPWLQYCLGLPPSLTFPVVTQLFPASHSWTNSPLFGLGFVTCKPNIMGGSASGHAWLWNHFLILTAQEGKYAHTVRAGVLCAKVGVVTTGPWKFWGESHECQPAFLPLGSLCTLSRAPSLTLTVQYHIHPLTISL